MQKGILLSKPVEHVATCSDSSSILGAMNNDLLSDFIDFVLISQIRNVKIVDLESI